MPHICPEAPQERIFKKFGARLLTILYLIDLLSLIHIILDLKDKFR